MISSLAVSAVSLVKQLASCCVNNHHCDKKTMHLYTTNPIFTTYAQFASSFFSDDTGWERHQLIGLNTLIKSLMPHC
jgi:hypothetical protein